jgi:SAM-dependent methyltransferase
VGDRAEGYVTELPYTLGYYPELNPRRINETLTAAGFGAVSIHRACELGFGRGLSLAIHAIAGDAEWWGNDLLPAHVEEVRELTRDLPGRPEVFDQTFVEFCSRDDLPNFDFIAMHGVWSWISEDNRRVIKEFIDRKLRSGGVLYLSYNTRQGWASVLPLRDFLVSEAARPALAGRPLTERIEAALIAAQQVVARDLPPARDDPTFEKHLRTIRGKAKSYLAHEYFNRDWALFDEDDIAATFEPLGFRYVAQAKGCAKSTDTSGFRRDVWIRDRKGGLSASAQLKDSPTSTDPASVHTLNMRLLRRALDEPNLSTLASPSTGGGIELGWRRLLALGAWSTGACEAGAIAAGVATAMARLGHPYVHEGVVIADPAEMSMMLRREAEMLLTSDLPRLRELIGMSGFEPPVSAPAGRR